MLAKCIWLVEADESNDLLKSGALLDPSGEKMQSAGRLKLLITKMQPDNPRTPGRGLKVVCVNSDLRRALAADWLLSFRPGYKSSGKLKRSPRMREMIFPIAESLK